MKCIDCKYLSKDLDKVVCRLLSDSALIERTGLLRVRKSEAETVVQLYVDQYKSYHDHVFVIAEIKQPHRFGCLLYEGK